MRTIHNCKICIEKHGTWNQSFFQLQCSCKSTFLVQSVAFLLGPQNAHQNPLKKPGPPSHKNPATPLQQTQHGSERQGNRVLNSTFQGMLKRHGIKFYTSENEDLKASVVEKFNRTLKTKMFRCFTHKNTRRYVDMLDDMLRSYNNTYHRSIAMAPVEVDVDNEDVVRRRLYPLKPTSYKWKYGVGDVRSEKGISAKRSRRISRFVERLPKQV